jgi:hypothetical protein
MHHFLCKFLHSAKCLRKLGFVQAASKLLKIFATNASTLVHNAGPRIALGSGVTKNIAFSGTPAMLIEKMSVGVLRVLTPVGPRYIRPELSQRLYLLWIFRHFQLLPVQVLSQRQQRWIDGLCTQHRFVSAPQGSGLDDLPVLGTVDWHLQPEEPELAPRRPSAGVRGAVARLAASVHHRS